MSRRRLVVLSHSAIEPSYQRKWEAVARRGFAVRLLVPDRWPETGRWLAGRARQGAALSVAVVPALWPGRVARCGNDAERARSRMTTPARPPAQTESASCVGA